MSLPTQNQINTALRYAGTAAGTIGAFVTVLGVIPPDSAHAIVAASQKVLTDLQQLVGDSYVLAALVFPAGVAVLARIGWHSASPKSQAASVEALTTAHVTTTDPALVSPGVTLVARLPVPPPTSVKGDYSK